MRTIKKIDTNELNTLVRVYRNLHTGTMSVQKYYKGKGWRLLGHADNLTLSNVQFCVNQNGRTRVLKERSKNVHAYIIGTLVSLEASSDTSVSVTYNPYKYGYFYNRDTNEPVLTADKCTIKDCKPFI